MKSFEELMTAVTKNIDYCAWSISSKTSIEKEDAYQDLLLIIWKEYCSRVESGRPVTKYFMQKRLYYASIRIMKSFYNSTESLTIYNGVGGPFDTSDVYDEKIEGNKIKEWINSVFDDYLRKESDKKIRAIFSMMRNGYRNCEISKSMDIKQNTLSLIITRKIKKALKEKFEENPFSDVVYHNEYVDVYS